MYRQKLPYQLLLISLLCFSFLFSGCSNNTDKTPTIDVDMIRTQAVNTLSAGLTQTEVAKPTMTVTMTPTITRTNTPAVSPTLNIPAGIPTSSSSSSSGVNTGCNQAAFVSDVTIPDGTVINPGAAFTKTWRFTNVGTCTWTTDYTLVFYSGSKMGGPDSQALTTTTIAPNGQLDVSVALTAPTESGTYLGYWAMQNAAKETFGIGAVGQPFYVQIKVETSSTATSTFTLTPTETVTPTP